jgi:hypothetical protein
MQATTMSSKKKSLQNSRYSKLFFLSNLGNNLPLMLAFQNGQEIIARMQYLGKLKTHLYRAKATTERPPVRGGEIFTSDGPAGHVVDFVELGYNNYVLLVTAKASAVGSKSFFLDPTQKIPLEV